MLDEKNKGHSISVKELEKIDPKLDYTPKTVEQSNKEAPKGLGGKTNREG